MGGGCFTDVMVYSSISYHQEHALPTVTEPRRLHKDERAACGAVIIRCQGISNLLEVLICNPCLVV